MEKLFGNYKMIRDSLIKSALRATSPVLLYHSVYFKVPESLRSGLHNVHPDEFAKQIRWLKQNFDIVEVESFFDDGFDRAGKVAITFDDGCKSVFENALPILQSEGIPSTVFVSGFSLCGRIFWRDKIRFLINFGLVDQFLEWSNLKFYEVDSGSFYKLSKSARISSRIIDLELDRFLSEKGFMKDVGRFLITSSDLNDFSNNNELRELVRIGNHTFSHFVLSSLSKTEQRIDIIENEAVLNSFDVRRSNVLAIPFGSSDDFNNDTVELVKEINFDGFLFSRNRLNLGVNKSAVERFMAPGKAEELPSLFLSLLTREVTRSIFR